MKTHSVIVTRIALNQCSMTFLVRRDEVSFLYSGEFRFIPHAIWLCSIIHPYFLGDYIQERVVGWQRVVDPLPVQLDLTILN